MIPIWDTAPSRKKPVVVSILIAANVAVFVYLFGFEAELGQFFREYGLVPAEYFHRADTQAVHQRVFPIFTSMFIHASWLHIIFNMLFLWVFGDNIEDRLGRVRFILFYLACGVAGAYAQLYLKPDSTLPMVGASGAVAGVMGGYLLLFPKARVLALVPLFYFVYPVELPAFLFLGFWFALQFLSGIATVLSGAGEAGGTAWWAHIGGFCMGLVLVKMLERRREVNEAQGVGGRRYGTSLDEEVDSESWRYAGQGGSSNFRVPGSGERRGW